MKITNIAVILLAVVFLQGISAQNYPDATLPATNAPEMTATDASSASATVTADTNSTMTSTSAVETAVSTPTTNEMTVTNETAQTEAVQTNEAASTNGIVATNATSAMNATNEMTATNETATSETANAATDTNAMPPIVFQDVPLTTAIETLARLANINYLLDPSINYGAAGKPEPTLSVRWENITYQQALLALLDNYGLQMIENPKTKIYRIAIKDPTAPPPLITRVIQLKYSSTSNMTAAVESALGDKRSRVLPDNRTSQLVVVGTESEQETVDSLINQLDRPTRQVLIETKIVELSSNPQTQKGIDWSGTLQAQNFSFGNGVLQGSSISEANIPGAPVSTTFGGHTFTTSSGSSVSTIVDTQPQNSSAPGGFSLNTASGLTPNIGFLSADGVKAVFSFLNESSEAKVLSTPRIVTLDNETATIEVTRAFPIFNTTAGTQGSPGGSQLTYSNLGTVLEVTPRISANDYIWLKVTPSVSSFFGTVTKIVGGFESQADEFDTRQIDTQVLIPNSHTLVMGGLVKDNPNSQFTKVPILGDIPVLGLAFRSENKSLERSDLLIFITPTIVRDSDFQPTESNFLNSKERTMRNVMKPQSWWDSAEPRGNWSYPNGASAADSSQNSSKTSVLP